MEAVKRLDLSERPRALIAAAPPREPHAAKADRRGIVEARIVAEAAEFIDRIAEGAAQEQFTALVGFLGQPEVLMSISRTAVDVVGD